MLEPVLVTGATGFVGSALMAELSDRGVAAIGVSRREDPARGLLGCDLTLPDAVDALFQRARPATVLHLASHVTGARDLDAVSATVHGTLLATIHVLSSASRVGARRVVLAGSMEELPRELGPRYPYAAAKRAASEYAALFCSAFALPTITARIGMVYGPGQYALQRLVPHVILSQLTGSAPQLASGKRVVDWIFVQDVVAGLLAMAEPAASELDGQGVDLGSGRAASVADVAEIIGRLTRGPAAALGALPDRHRDPDIFLDVEPAQRVFGFRAPTSLEAGLALTVEWYRRERAAGRL
jgi:nucleoside-diphosphate-sugar epimerase